ncbi:hypothetical protein HMPREF3219_0200932 [Streptococcus salivarius]|nr:hypothetical protein HMPREF3219_0200932 [Streptococcus salivarius]
MGYLFLRNFHLASFREMMIFQYLLFYHNFGYFAWRIKNL